MSIVEHIRSVAEDQGLPFRYGTDEELNHYCENTPVPAVFMSLLQTGRDVVVGAEHFIEHDVVLTFIDKTSFDLESIENEQIVERMRATAQTFRDALKNEAELEVGDAQFRDVYLRYASVYTGTSVSMRVRSSIGTCCKPNPSRYERLLAKYQELTNQYNELYELYQECIKMGQCCDELTARMNEVEQSIESLRADLTAAAGVGTENTEKIAEQGSTIESLRADLTAAAGVGTENTEKIAEQGSTIESLRADLTAAAGVGTANTEKIAEQGSTIESLRADLTAAAGVGTANTQKIAEQGSTIESLRADLTAAAGVGTANTQKIAEQGATIETQGTTIEGHTTTLAEHTKQIADVQEDMNENIVNISTLESKVNGHDEAISQLKEGVNENIVNISTLESKVNGHDEAISQLQDDVALLVKSGMLLSVYKELYAYGVAIDTNNSSPDLVRIGRNDLHRELPVQSKMRGCLLDDDGKVVKYLSETNWTAEERDGSAGQVMVEIPKHYVRFETEGATNKVWLSEYPIEGFTLVPTRYVGAYEASLQRSTMKLASVVNKTADYRGGDNQADWDTLAKSQLGMPATAISRTYYRKYARNRKEGSTEWNAYVYDVYKEVFWLFVVEYATLNSQKAYNAAKTSEGFMQGGLGEGVTNLNSTKWNTFTGYYPFIPCGYTDHLGNGTGVVDYQMPAEYDEARPMVSVNRYRGIEMPFGHLWQWIDGINVRISADEANGGDGLSKVFVCHDPAKFSDTGYEGYDYIGNEARTNGYMKTALFGETGDMMTSTIGAGTTTYYCDRHYTNIPTSGEALRGVLFGGDTASGAYAGFAGARSDYGPSVSSALFGSRLCFIPRDNESNE